MATAERAPLVMVPVTLLLHSSEPALLNFLTTRSRPFEAILRLSESRPLSVGSLPPVTNTFPRESTASFIIQAGPSPSSRAQRHWPSLPRSLTRKLPAPVDVKDSFPNLTSFRK